MEFATAFDFSGMDGVAELSELQKQEIEESGAIENIQAYLSMNPELLAQMESEYTKELPQTEEVFPTGPIVNMNPNHSLTGSEFFHNVWVAQYGEDYENNPLWQFMQQNQRVGLRDHSPNIFNENMNNNNGSFRDKYHEIWIDQYGEDYENNPMWQAIHKNPKMLIDNNKSRNNFCIRYTPGGAIETYPCSQAEKETQEQERDKSKRKTYIAVGLAVIAVIVAAIVFIKK